MVYKIFDKNTAVGAVKNELMQNNELTKEFLKPVIRKLKNEKYSHL